MCYGCWRAYCVPDEDDPHDRFITSDEYETAKQSGPVADLLVTLTEAWQHHGASVDWFGGPGHVQMDDWNLDIPLYAEPPPYMKGHKDEGWFDEGSPYMRLVPAWNDTDEYQRAMALAAYEGWVHPDDEPPRREPRTDPPLGSVRFGGYDVPVLGGGGV